MLNYSTCLWRHGGACDAVQCVRGTAPNMLLALPQELQAAVMLQSDVKSAGRLAQASCVCKHLGQERLRAFVVAKRKELSDMAATQHTPGSRSAAVFAHFESLNSARPFRYRCWCISSAAAAATLWTPCALVLMDNSGRPGHGLPIPLLSHLRRCHSISI